MHKDSLKTLFCISFMVIPTFAQAQLTEADCSKSKAQAAELRRKIDLYESTRDNVRNGNVAQFAQLMERKYDLIRAEEERLESCEPTPRSAPLTKLPARGDSAGESFEPTNTYHPLVRVPVVVSGTEETLAPSGEHYVSTRDGKIYILTGPNNVVDPQTGRSISVASQPQRQPDIRPEQIIEAPTPRVPAPAASSTPPAPTPASASAPVPAGLAKKPHKKITKPS